MQTDEVEHLVLNYTGSSSNRTNNGTLKDFFLQLIVGDKDPMIQWVRDRRATSLQ